MVTRIIFSSKILFIQIRLIPYPLFVKEIDFIDCQIFQMSVKAHKVVHTELMKYIAMRMTCDFDLSRAFKSFSPN